MIVRLDAIGDFVVWLDAAKELRRLYAGRKLVLVGNAVWAGLASRIGYWDEVWPVDVARMARRPDYRLRLLVAIRRRGFAEAIQPTYSRLFGVGDALIRASGARDRTGSAGDLSNMTPAEKARADRWYTRLVSADERPLMEVERNAEFMRGFGAPSFETSCPRLPRLGDLREELRVQGPYRVLVPGASAALRQWPPERFAETVDGLSREAPFTTVICGSSGERALCEDVASRIAGGAVNLAGRTAVWEMVEVIRGAQLVITNETSAVHIAAAVGTPAVCIVGGGHYGRFMPYAPMSNGEHLPRTVTHRMDCFGCNWHCSQPHRPGGAVPCVSGVTVADVLRHAEEALSA